jgi:hypothetical protein
MRWTIRKSKANQNPPTGGSNVLVKESARQAVRELLRNQVPENAPTFKQIGNHVLVGVRVSTR